MAKGLLVEEMEKLEDVEPAAVMTQLKVARESVGEVA